MNDAFWVDQGVSLIAAVVLAILAVALNSWLHNRQLRKAKRVEFLLRAYRELEFNSNRGNIPNKIEFERAVADVFLLGSPRQIALTEKIMDDMVAESVADTADLLKVLRDDLRMELNLEKVPGKFKFLRLSRHLAEMDILYREGHYDRDGTTQTKIQDDLRL